MYQEIPENERNKSVRENKMKWKTIYLPIYLYFRLYNSAFFVFVFSSGHMFLNRFQPDCCSLHLLSIWTGSRKHTHSCEHHFSCQSLHVFLQTRWLQIRIHFRSSFMTAIMHRGNLLFIIVVVVVFCFFIFGSLTLGIHPFNVNFRSAFMYVRDTKWSTAVRVAALLVFPGQITVRQHM